MQEMSDQRQDQRDFPKGGMDEHGNTTPGYRALREALGRIVLSLPSAPTAGNSIRADVTPERGDSLTSAESVGRAETAFLRATATFSSGSVGLNHETRDIGDRQAPKSFWARLLSGLGIKVLDK